MRRGLRLRQERVPVESIYDHPLYYDILFSWNRANEARFYHEAFSAAGLEVGARILEVGCGPGQVGRRLARLGWQVAGLDSRPAMVDFMVAEAAREGLQVEGLHGDMTDGVPGPPFDAAFNPLSSFRLLHDDAAARSHLEAVVACLIHGGVYVLDLDFLDKSREFAATTDEAWEMTRGDITVRAAGEGITVTEAGTQLRLCWGEGEHLRGMTWSAFDDLVDACRGLEIEACHLESGRDAEGISQFEPESEPDERRPILGRAMVVLRRR